jgi:urease gamma subunit
MFNEFDQNTIAKMTAALEHVCKKLPADKDNPETRKLVANAIMDCARAGRRSIEELQNAGLKVLREITRPKRFNWFGRRPT